jgi:hypothetical protein
VQPEWHGNATQDPHAGAQEPGLGIGNPRHGEPVTRRQQVFTYPEGSDNGMKQRIAGTVIGRAATITMGLLLAAAALPAAPASASSSVVSWWQPTGGGAAYENTYSCTPNNYGPQGRPLEVYNPCGTRVWLHYDDTATGQIYAYCVNPGGGLAYGFTYPVTDIQVTANASQCDYSATAGVWWASGVNNEVEDSYNCNVGDTFTWTGYVIVQTLNYCNVRIWLHGSGNSSLCISPTGSAEISSSPYSELQMSANQTPCNAGGPPYPY